MHVYTIKCLLGRQFSWNVKPYFLWKIKKNRTFSTILFSALRANIRFDFFLFFFVNYSGCLQLYKSWKGLQCVWLFEGEGSKLWVWMVLKNMSVFHHFMYRPMWSSYSYKGKTRGIWVAKSWVLRTRSGGSGFKSQWRQNSAHDCTALHCTEPIIIIFHCLDMT